MRLTYRGVSYQNTSEDLTDKLQLSDLENVKKSTRLSPVPNRIITDICVLKYRGIEFIKIIYH